MVNESASTIASLGVFSLNVRDIFGGEPTFIKVDSGTYLEVREKEVGENKHKVMVVSIAAAQQNSLFAGMEKLDVFVTCGQLRSEKFSSKLSDGTEVRRKQELLWKFVRDLLVDEGVIYGASQRPAKKKLRENSWGKFSRSVPLFRQAVLGFYRFKGVVVRLGTSFHTKKNTRKREELPSVTIISIRKDDPLFEKARVGTVMLYRVIGRDQMPEFRGPYANDLKNLWLFLKGVIKNDTKPEVRDSV